VEVLLMRRYPLEALMEATGLSEAHLARRVGMDGTTLKRARENGLVASAADRYAVRAGFVPWLVWPEWIADQIEDCSQPCEECGSPFVPVKKGHRFCNRTCGSRNLKRRRYQDPEFRAKERARNQAYKEASRHAARLYAATYRAANREALAEAQRARRAA
jgi:hypothetical protein